MSAAVVSEAMVINPSNANTIESPPTVTAKLVVQNDSELAKCDCCGLTEECTPAYIERIRERYQGKWICGLCAEAVKYEMRLLSTEEALIQHMSFCNKFKSSTPPPNPAVHLISTMRRILRRSMDSARSMPSTPSKRGVLTRSDSCIPALPDHAVAQCYWGICSGSKRCTPFCILAGLFQSD